MGATEVFLLAMTLFPEVQIRAQQEIDEVVGQDTLTPASQAPARGLGYGRSLHGSTRFQGRARPFISMPLTECWAEIEAFRSHAHC